MRRRNRDTNIVTDKDIPYRIIHINKKGGKIMSFQKFTKGVKQLNTALVKLYKTINSARADLVKANQTINEHKKKEW